MFPKRSILSLVRQTPHHLAVSTHFVEALTGIGDVIETTDYEMVVRYVSREEEEDVLRYYAESGKVDGIILHQPSINDSRIPLLNALGIPFVVDGKSIDCEAEYDYVDTANDEAIYVLTKHLLELGHRRIAFLNGNERLSFAYAKRQGFERAFQEASIEIDASLLYHSEMTESYGYAVADMILDAPRDSWPTAFIGACAMIGRGINRALVDRGYRVPQDFSVAIYESGMMFMRTESGKPEFTGSGSPVIQTGALLAKTLLAKIAKSDEHSGQIVLPPTFVAAGTVSAPQAI